MKASVLWHVVGAVSPRLSVSAPPPPSSACVHRQRRCAALWPWPGETCLCAKARGCHVHTAVLLLTRLVRASLERRSPADAQRGKSRSRPSLLRLVDDLSWRRATRVRQWLASIQRADDIRSCCCAPPRVSFARLQGLVVKRFPFLARFLWRVARRSSAPAVGTPGTGSNGG